MKIWGWVAAAAYVGVVVLANVLSFKLGPVAARYAREWHAKYDARIAARKAEIR